MSINKLPQHIRELYEAGERCLGKVYKRLTEWHVAEYCRRIPFGNKSEADQKQILQDLLDIKQWLSAVGTQRAIHDQRMMKEIQQTLEFAVLEEDFKNNSIESAKAAIEEALLLVTSIPLPQNSSAVNYPYRFVTVPNTAFIMMAMDSSQPELEDVYSTVKDACSCYRKKAFRADDVQHNGQIYKVVFECIATSELLIADLTGEKQNVYYEVGIAHALGKQPILFCKSDTKIHYNLVGNNVIEYRNFADLRKLLQNRLKGMYRAA
jgi:hypothetical protein